MILAVLAFCFAGCVSGGGTDVGNALVNGRVTDGGDGGAAVAGARVFLMPDGYDPIHGDTTGRVRWENADAEGRFALSDVKPGRYALEARHPSLDRMSWTRELVVEKGGRLILNPSLAGSRTLKILLPPDAAADAYVFIPASDVQVRRDSTGADTLLLGKCPLEAIPTLALGSRSGLAATRYFQVSISSQPSDTLVILKDP
jgi:hypothetical protein